KDYRQFLREVYKKTEIKQAVVTFPFAKSDPLDYLNSLDPQNEFLFFNEKTAIQKTMAAGGCAAEVTASGPNRFSIIQQKIDRLKKQTIHFNALNANTGFYILGGFSFFDEIELTGWDGFKAASFTLPKRAIVKNGQT